MELERLLIIVIPKRYNELLTDPFESQVALPSLEHCFRSAFNIVNDELKKKVMKKFVAVLKEEDEAIVLSYETAFFRGSDLKYLSASDTKIVKEHLLSRLSKDATLPLFQALKDIGKYLTVDDAQNFIDSLVRSTILGKEEIKNKAKNFLNEEYLNMKKNTKDKVLDRLDDWIPHLEKNKRTVDADTVRSIKSSLEF